MSRTDSTQTRQHQAEEGCGVELLHKGAVLQASFTSSRTRLARCVTLFRENLFLLLTSAGILAGILAGLTIRIGRPGPDALSWVGLPGEIYMRILQAMILPLIICTVIDGTASADPKSNGRVGLVTLGYIIITNALGGITGIVLALLIQPGSHGDHKEGGAPPDTRNLKTTDIFTDLIRNIFPDNVVAATLQMSQTKYTVKSLVTDQNFTSSLTNVSTSQLVKSVTSVPGTNILGLIVVSAAVGIAASKTRDQTRVFVDFFKAGARVTFQLFEWAKWTTPVGVASMTAASLARVDKLESAFSSMAMFVLTTSGGCLLYQWLVLPAIMLLLTRRNPLKFLGHAFKAWLLALGSAVSTIPLPEMLRVSVEIYRVDPRVASFTLPFCVTLNRDGSCLYISATCLFVAQYSGLELTTGDILTITTLCIMTSLAIPTVPSASVVGMLIIMGSVGISTQNIGLVMAVEWFNDRVRTTTNVMSHMVGALVTWSLCRRSLTSKSLGDSSLSVVRPRPDV